MNKKFKDEQKKRLIHLRQEILKGMQGRGNEDLIVKSEELADEGDLAQTVSEQNVSFNLREKDLKKLREIELALERLQSGSYGLCEECDETIPEKRLERLPTATLCVEHAEDLERKQSQFNRVG